MRDEADRIIGFRQYSTSGTLLETYYYEFNAQGDVVALYNSSKAIVAKYTYDSWGKLLSVTNASGSAITAGGNVAIVNPIRYRGYYYDNETGLYYLNSRYYDPATRRFINADDTDVITATPGGLTDKNLYTYCDNNPIVRKDNGGQFWNFVAKVGIGLASQYVSDVIGNVVSGKTGWDVLKPTSSVGEYVAAGVTAIIPGNGIGSIITRNVVTEGIVCAEKRIKGEEVDLKESAVNVIAGVAVDSAFGKVSKSVDEKIASRAPRNYSTYAGAQYKKNPTILKTQIYRKLRRYGNIITTARNIASFAIDAARGCL